MTDLWIWIAFLIGAATIIDNAIMSRSKASHKAMQQTIALLKEQLSSLERDRNRAKDRIHASDRTSRVRRTHQIIGELHHSTDRGAVLDGVEFVAAVNR